MLNSYRIGMCAAEKTGVDHISELPVHLLHRILSKLPLNEAGRTTVLGKPWRRAWDSFLISDFDDEFFPNRDSCTDPFVPFVNEHLQRLCNQQRLSLQRFKLCVKYYHFELRNYIDDWINLAAAHHVKHLHLNRPVYTLFSVFPSSIYAHSLQVLELRSGQLREPEGYSIDSLKFPSLKQLHLQEIELTENFLTSLVNSCPLLEQLSIIICQGLLDLRLCGLAKLKSLKVYQVCIQTLRIDQAESLESLIHCVSYKGHPCDVKITGCKKLKVLKFVSMPICKQWLALLSDFPALETLQIRQCTIHGTLNLSNRHLKHLDLSTRDLHPSCPVLHDSINLHSFTYRGHIKPRWLQFINTSTVQTAKFVFMYRKLHSLEFFQLRQFLSTYSQAKTVNLHISSRSPKVIFHVENIRRKLNFQKKILNHVQLTIKNLTKSVNYKDLVDGLIWTIRVRTLSIKLYPRLSCQDFDSTRNIQLIKVLCETLMNITKELCCALSQYRCWRHYFKSVEVVWRENESCNCERLLELLPNFPLYDHHTISFKFQY